MLEGVAGAVVCVRVYDEARRKVGEGERIVEPDPLVGLVCQHFAGLFVA